MDRMAAPDNLIRREYQTLVRKLRVARGFCFIVYFVEDRRPALLLKASLQSRLNGEDREFVDLSGQVADDFVQTTLTGIFNASNPIDSARVGAVWVETFNDAGEPRWNALRQELLMRMNERRSRFEKELRAPLILLLPAGSERDVATLAPDLWHIRLHSAVLRAGDGLLSAPWVDSWPPSEMDGAFGREVLQSGRGGSAVPPAVVYWNSLVAAASAGETDDNSENQRPAELNDGIAAVNAWLSVGNAIEAAKLSELLVEHAGPATRQRFDEHEMAQPSLAFLMIKSGDALRQAGRTLEAIHRFSEGIELARSMSISSAPLPLLWLGLMGLGRTELERANPEAALASYLESASVSRRLAALNPANPAQSRELALSLEGLGDASLALNRHEQALSAFAEAVDLRRRAGQREGERAVDVRNLAVAIGKMGDAQQRLGRGESAAQAYRESLALLMELRAKNEDPQTAIHLSVVLNRIGDAEAESGRCEPALRHYQQSLALLRRLRTSAFSSSLVDDSLRQTLARIRNARTLVLAETTEERRGSR